MRGCGKPVLRWKACSRQTQSEGLCPREAKGELPLTTVYLIMSLPSGVPLLSVKLLINSLLR